MATQDVRIRYVLDTSQLSSGARAIDQLSDAERELSNQTENAAKSLKEQDQATSKLDGTIKNLGKTILAAFTIDQLIQFGKEVINVTAEFQKLQAVLKTALGSKSEAQRSFQQILEFAKATPFQVQEITESYVRLVNRGLKPTNDQLRSMGDLAASQGKTFLQFTEAVLDATTFQFERLREFGITARTEGEKVTFMFKGQETQVAKTDKAIREYLIGLGNVEGISGSMAEVSDTLFGKLSNLKDSFDQLFFAIGSLNEGPLAGFIDLVTSGVNAVTKFIQGIQGMSLEELRKEQELLNFSLDDFAKRVGRGKTLTEEQQLQYLQLAQRLQEVKDRIAELENPTVTVDEVTRDFLNNLETGVKKATQEIERMGEVANIKLRDPLQDLKIAFEVLFGEDLVKFMENSDQRFEESTSRLESEVDKRIKAINRERQAHEDKIQAEFEREQQLARAKIVLANSVANGLAQVGRFVGALGEEGAAFAKAEALFQIAADTARAIGSLTAGAEKTGATVPFGGILAAVQFATGLARILTNIALAHNILSSTPEPKFKEQEPPRVREPRVRFRHGVKYLQLGGNPQGSDTIPAYLDEGERVVDKWTNREYFDSLNILHDRRIPSREAFNLLNSYTKRKSPVNVINKNDISTHEIHITEHGLKRNVINNNHKTEVINSNYKY